MQPSKYQRCKLCQIERLLKSAYLRSLIPKCPLVKDVVRIERHKSLRKVVCFVNHDDSDCKEDVMRGSRFGPPLYEFVLRARHNRDHGPEIVR